MWQAHSSSVKMTFIRFICSFSDYPRLRFVALPLLPIASSLHFSGGSWWSSFSLHLKPRVTVFVYSSSNVHFIAFRIISSWHLSLGNSNSSLCAARRYYCRHCWRLHAVRRLLLISFTIIWWWKVHLVLPVCVVVLLLWLFNILVILGLLV